jgi:hypothetical protein
MIHIIQFQFQMYFDNCLVKRLKMNKLYNI